MTKPFYTTEYIDAEYPEHSRTSCSDEHPNYNATPDGQGCPRCSALIFQRAEKVADLERWKAEATTVLNDLRLQEIAAELGIPPGVSIAPRTLPGIQKIKRERDRLIADMKVLVKSATPHPEHHPTMHSAWKQAQATLADLGHKIPRQHLK